MRIYTKWWLVRQLHKDCRGHTLNLPIEALQLNAKHSVAREALVLHVARKKEDEQTKFLYKDGNIESRLKRRIYEYNSIFDECIREALVHVETENTLIDRNTGTILNPPSRPFFRTTDLGDNFTTYTSLSLAIKKELSAFLLLIAWLITTAIAVIATILLR